MVLRAIYLRRIRYVDYLICNCNCNCNFNYLFFIFFKSNININFWFLFFQYKNYKIEILFILQYNTNQTTSIKLNKAK